MELFLFHCSEFNTNPPWRQRMRVEKQSRYAFFFLSLLSNRADAEMQQASLSLGREITRLCNLGQPLRRATTGRQWVRSRWGKFCQRCDRRGLWSGVQHTHRIAFHSFAPTAFPPPPKCSNRACQHHSRYTGIACDDSYASISHHSHWSDSLSNCYFLVNWFMFPNGFLFFTINKVSHKG